MARGDFASEIISRSPETEDMNDIFDVIIDHYLPKQYQDFVEFDVGQIRIKQNQSSWNFQISIKDPYNVIFTQQCCQFYDRISSFYLRLRKYENNIIIAQRKKETKNDKQYSILLYKIHIFLQILSHHFYSIILIPQTEKVINIFSTTTSFNDLLDAHDRFITTLSNCCYLTSKYKSALDALSVVFNQITIILNKLSNEQSLTKNFLFSIREFCKVLSTIPGSRSLSQKILSRFP